MLCMTPNVSYHMADGPRRPGDSCRSGHRMRRRAPTNARRGLQAGWLTPGDVTPTRVTLARPGLLECEKNVMALAIKTAPSAGGNLMSGPPSLLCLVSRNPLTQIKPGHGLPIRQPQFAGIQDQCLRTLPSAPAALMT